MSSRKAQIKINEQLIVHYVFNKISDQEEELIEDVLFENDRYAVVMDKLLSFVIQYRIKQKKLEQIFKIHHITDLEDLAKEIKSVTFQPSFYESPNETYKDESIILQAITSVNWQFPFKLQHFGKKKWQMLLTVTTISFLVLNLNVTTLHTGNLTSVAQYSQFTVEYVADSPGLRLFPSLWS